MQERDEATGQLDDLRSGRRQQSSRDRCGLGASRHLGRQVPRWPDVHAPSSSSPHFLTVLSAACCSSTAGSTVAGIFPMVTRSSGGVPKSGDLL